MLSTFKNNTQVASLALAQSYYEIHKRPGQKPTGLTKPAELNRAVRFSVLVSVRAGLVWCFIQKKTKILVQFVVQNNFPPNSIKPNRSCKTL